MTNHPSFCEKVVKMPPRKGQQAKAKAAKKETNKEEDEEYRAKREKNNIAVKKSREQTRAKMKETVERVDHLRDENKHLEKKCDILAKELKMLKDLFAVHAQSQCSGSTEEATEEASSSNKKPSSSAKRKSAGTSDVNISALTMDHEYSTPAKKKR